MSHPHLITIYAYCENKDGCLFEERKPKNPFLLMEHIQGRTLESYIRKIPDEGTGVFNIDRQRLHTAIQIASALNDLHEKETYSSRH